LDDDVGSPKEDKKENLIEVEEIKERQNYDTK
jgi:hypothetical protein